MVAYSEIRDYRPVLTLDFTGPMTDAESLPKSRNLPAFIQEFIHHYPPLGTMLSEMERLNAVTFTHSIMTALCFAEMTEKMMPLLKAYLPEISPDEMDRRIVTYREGALIHDLGKWTLTKDPVESSKIVSSDVVRLIDGTFIDKRSTDNRKLHESHPVIGQCAINALSEMVREIPLDKIIRWRFLVRWHHDRQRAHALEENHGHSLATDFKEDRLDKVLQLFIRLSDMAVATGQPRDYFKARQPQADVIKHLNFVLRDENIMDALELPQPFLIAEFKGQVLVAAMDGLEAVQKEFHPNHCLDPIPYMLDDGESLASLSNEDCPFLHKLASNVWNTYGSQLLTEMKNAPVYKDNTIRSQVVYLSTAAPIH